MLCVEQGNCGGKKTVCSNCEKVDGQVSVSSAPHRLTSDVPHTLTRDDKVVETVGGDKVVETVDGDQVVEIVDLLSHATEFKHMIEDAKEAGSIPVDVAASLLEKLDEMGTYHGSLATSAGLRKKSLIEDAGVRVEGSFVDVHSAVTKEYLQTLLITNDEMAQHEDLSSPQSSPMLSALSRTNSMPALSISPISIGKQELEADLISIEFDALTLPGTIALADSMPSDLAQMSR